ncbi:MAG TPA: Holliday junction resolvase RuvX [Candidatus Methylacidiphilales bacterium]|jgi:putative Holliday junction resolvase|nr:Holliday junction resolvase RuvX [Candidatus Methylacidiphilales bacterium]
MRVLAIDYGAVRIGLALSDPTGTLARPLPFLPAKADTKLAKEILALAARENVARILLGLPRHMSGESGEAALKVQAFAKTLGAATSLPLELVDERLTTVQASRQLQESGRKAREQRGRIDSEAAAVLLQGWLDARSALLPPDA